MQAAAAAAAAECCVHVNRPASTWCTPPQHHHGANTHTHAATGSRTSATAAHALPPCLQHACSCAHVAARANRRPILWCLATELSSLAAVAHPLLLTQPPSRAGVHARAPGALPGACSLPAPACAPHINPARCAAEPGTAPAAAGLPRRSHEHLAPRSHCTAPACCC